MKTENTTPSTAGSATGIDLGRATIRDIFMKHGFTIKEGQTDLKPYVYAAADDLIALARATPQQDPVPTCAEAQADEAKLYRDLTGDAMAMGFDGLPAALEALRATPQHPQTRALREVSRQQVDQKLATTGATAYERFLWAELTRLQAAVIADAATQQHSVTEQSRPTDISERLRERAMGGYTAVRPEDGALMLTAAVEIERYYGGMMAWKRAAEAKDAAFAQPLASTAATQPERASALHDAIRSLSPDENHDAFTSWVSGEREAYLLGHRDARHAAAELARAALAISASTAVPEGDSFKPVYWFSVLMKCARLLNLPDDEPIPSGVLRAVEALTASTAASEQQASVSDARAAFDARHFGYEFPSAELRSGAYEEFAAGYRAALSGRATIPSEADERANPVKIFTCIGKGGEYELVGYSNGAGPKRGESIVVYFRTDAPDVLYHRGADDFKERMQWLRSRAALTHRATTASGEIGCGGTGKFNDEMPCLGCDACYREGATTAADQQGTAYSTFPNGEHALADQQGDALRLLQNAARAWNNEDEPALDTAMEEIEIFLIDARGVPAATRDADPQGEAGIPASGDTASASIRYDAQFNAMLMNYSVAIAINRDGREAYEKIVAHLDSRAQQGAAQAQAGESRDLIAAGALRQYRHNDGSGGFVFAYDKAITDRMLSRDVARLIEDHRIAITPEHEGGFHAQIYLDADVPQASGYGPTARAAIDAAMTAPATSKEPR